MSALVIRPLIVRMEFDGMAEPDILCAANVYYWAKFPLGYLIIPGPRHGSPIMNDLLDALRVEHQVTGRFYEAHIQGFIDQFGNFYNREQAYKLVQLTGKKFDPERNGSDYELFSEGIC